MFNFVESESKEEIKGLKDLLNSNYPADRKMAAKRVLSLMRAGENVLHLFSDMLRLVKTNDIELKKYVYLYLVSHANQEPEQAIMAVSAFDQDSQDSNPLIRGLAVRTMCLIKIESVAEHMILPLKRALKDYDPYVRKSAAFGVSKLFSVIPEAVENSNLFPDLLGLLNDGNPMVVSNTAISLFEINSVRSVPIFELTSNNLGPILAALVSSSEWCQISLLDAISKYVPVNQEDATLLIDRLIPMLKNSNPSVVIGAFKSIYLFLEYDTRSPKEIFSVIIPPFITLVTSSESEIQYVVLRTLSLFVQKYPKILSKEIRVFFCKYNDPSYIKMEKLDIIIRICSSSSAKLVLDELNEYCNDIDVAFVKKSVRAIGQIALKIPAATNRCVDILVGLTDGKADYAIEEALIVMSDLLRKYPGSYEGVIASVCQNLEKIHDPKSKSAAIWILGEFCSIIESIESLIEIFIENFLDEQPIVQLQLITAMIKIYLTNPGAAQNQLQLVLDYATKGDVTPDVRNRADFYWKLLSVGDDQLSKGVVFFDHKSVDSSDVQYDDLVLVELIKNMGCVSGVLHVVPSDFVQKISYEPDDLLFQDESLQWKPVQMTDPSSPIVASVSWNSASLRFLLKNNSEKQLDSLQIAINKNVFGIAFTSNPTLPPYLDPDASYTVEIPITFSEAKVDLIETGELDIAIKTNLGNCFGKISIPALEFCLPDGKVTQNQFSELWRSEIPEAVFEIQNLVSDDLLKQRNVFVVGKSEERVYLSLFLPPDNIVIFEIFKSLNQYQTRVKTKNNRFLQYLGMNIQSLFGK